MHADDKNAAARFISSSVRFAEEHGVSLHIGGDFPTYASLVRKGRKSNPVTVPFDSAHQAIDTSNAFWISGTNEKGELVHTQAMRMVDLEGKSLADYLHTRFIDFPPAGVNLDLSKSRYVPGPGARRARGTACYHGEVWVKEKAQGLRGSGLAGLLGRLGMIIAMVKWQPDYMFGFMPKSVAHKGFAEREGYMHAEQGALRWYRKDTADFLEGFMVWMAAEDLKHLLHVSLFGADEEFVSPELLKAVALRHTSNLLHRNAA